MSRRRRGRTTSGRFVVRGGVAWISEMEMAELYGQWSQPASSYSLGKLWFQPEHQRQEKEVLE